MSEPAADSVTATSASPTTGLPLAGMTVLVTGSIDGLTRDEAKDAIKALGGIPAAGVSGKLDLLVLGEGAGVSKTAKARSFKTPVLDGETFAALHANPTSWDGQPVGMTFADYDAAHGEDEAEDRAANWVDPAHWVGKSVGYVVDDEGVVRRQVRLWCACGHRWMRRELWGSDACPRPEVPDASVPWERADPYGDNDRVPDFVDGLPY